MSASVGSMLQQIQYLSGKTQAPTAALDPQNRIPLDIVRQLMQTMAPSVDSLINQLLPIKTAIGNRPISSATSSVIDAKVLSSTLLTNSSSTSTTPGSANSPKPQYQILISTPQQNYKLTSTTSLEVGSSLQLKPTNNGLALVLNTSSNTTAEKLASAPQARGPLTTQLAKEQLSSEQIAKNLPPRDFSNSPQQALHTKPQPHTSLSTSQQSHPIKANTTLQTDNKTVPTAKNIPLSRKQAPFNQTQIIDQGIRQALPKQQALNLLLPILQKTLSSTAPSQQQLPKELLQNIRLLVNQFQTAEKLQQVPRLKNAIQNSGVFLETKIAKQLTATANTAQAKEKTTAAILNSDIKSLTQKLYQLVQQQTVQNKTKESSSPETAANLLYTAKPLPQTTAPGRNRPSGGSDKNLDVVLRQLGQQLLSSIARTQLHQLEGLSNRGSSPDNPASANSWSLDIPIINGNHVDNLELRIHQEKAEQDKESDEKETQKIWSVMLDFDLHQLGKMSVQLKIRQKLVSAVIWSALESTHIEVHQQIASLQKGLEKVGVTVKQVDCRLGSPPKTNRSHYRQLVDVIT